MRFKIQMKVILVLIIAILSLGKYSIAYADSTTKYDDGHYRNTITGKKYKYGRWEKDYNGVVEIVVNQGKIHVVYFSGDREDRLYDIWNRAKAEEKNQVLERDATKDTIDAISSATLTGELNSHLNSKKYVYVMNLKTALQQAFDAGKIGVENGEEIYIADIVAKRHGKSKTKNGILVVKIKDGKILSIDFSGEDKEDFVKYWIRKDDKIKKSGLIGKEASQETVDAITSPTLKGQSIEKYDANFQSSLRDAINQYLQTKKEEKVTVNFNTNSDSENPQSQEIKKGEKAIIPKIPTKEGFNFLGWFVEDSQEPFNFDTKINENITLTAKWEKIKIDSTYNIIIETDDGATVKTTPKNNAKENDVVVVEINVADNKIISGIELIYFDGLTEIGYPLQLIDGTNKAEFHMPKSDVTIKVDTEDLITPANPEEPSTPSVPEESSTPVVPQEPSNERWIPTFTFTFTKSKKDTTKEKSVLESNNTIFKVGASYYDKVLDGKKERVNMDVSSFIQNDRMMLSIRYVAYALGFDVEYNNETREAIFINKSNNNLLQKKIKINIDTGLMTDDYGNTYQSDSKPIIVNGRLFASVSNIGKVFGATTGKVNDKTRHNIEWDSVKKEVHIYRNIK